MRIIVILFAIASSACSLYSGADPIDTPDAQAEPSDAPADCDGLPSCFDLGCAVGALPLDCPRPDDPTAPCFCDAPSGGAWCMRP